VTRGARSEGATAAAILVPCRVAKRPPRGLGTNLLAALWVCLFATACATLDVRSPAERSEVRPGGPRRSDTLASGEPVPDFVAPGLGGAVVRWRDHDGSATVLVVWASWCPHCQRLLPALVRVARDYPAVRILTVTTSIGRYGGPSPREFVEQHGLSFPVALDDVDNTLARALGVFRYPTVYWVGRDGRVRGVSEGEVSDAALRHAFELVLAGTL
jgi:thiol-disulfide isomerase/thioredoxin